MLTAVEATTDPGVIATGVPEADVARYKKLGCWVGDTHMRMLMRTGTQHGEEVVAVDRYRQVTYTQLVDAAQRAGAWLRAAGVRRGEAVIVQLPNCVAYLETIFGIWSIGAIPVFTLPAHGALEIGHFHRNAPARFYVGPMKGDVHNRRVRDSLAEQAPELTLLSVDTQALDPWGCEPITDVAEVSPQELAFLQLSGGTTGVPKLIPKTHDDYLYSVRQSLVHCDLDATSTVLVVLPASHNFTMSSPGILGAIMVGARIVFSPDPMPRTILTLIQKHRVTHCAAVPPIILSLLNYPHRADYDLSSWRTAWVGGAKLSENVARRVTPELGCALQQVFGMAEGLVNYTRLGDDMERIVTTQGSPMSDYDELRVVDSAGKEVSPGEVGELLTRGPYTIRRYHRNPEVNARSFTADGFYRTGDLVTVTEDRTITVVGRVKDQINRGGEKVAPEAVENALLAHPAIHDVSVVGIPDEMYGERVCAYVIPKQRSDTAGGEKDKEIHEITEVEVKQFARQAGLAAFAVPDVVHIVDEFPLTGVGKVSKKDQR
ncbi:(2,3-dihydroxybenzoyl)adenylate synthase [Corynebacterium pyruviciproducens]